MDQMSLFGVCEWLSGRTNFTTKEIRIFFILAVLLGGFGIGLYLLLWLVMTLSK